MKLKNKKTGEIGTLMVDGAYNFVTNLAVEDDERNRLGEYDSLAELNEEWEDAPEDFYIVEQRGTVGSRFRTGDEYEKKFKSIGNYFESREEAEKAVEKLKAWKRLKDKGFSIYSWDYEFDMVDKPAQTIILRASAVDSSNEDLDLLFGGEE